MQYTHFIHTNLLHLIAPPTLLHQWADEIGKSSSSVTVTIYTNDGPNAIPNHVNNETLREEKIHTLACSAGMCVFLGHG